MAIQKPTPAKRKKRKTTKGENPNRDLIRDLIAIGKSVSKEQRASLPHDLAANFDHYHDGSPRQD